MKNHYTKQTNSLWLKSFLFTFFTCFAALTAHAQIVDFGAMELDKAYTIKGDFNDYKGHFIAKKSGTLTASASFSCLMLPYNDEEGTSQPDYDHVFTDTGESFTMEVEEGKTYYLFLPFSMSEGTFMMTMNADNSIRMIASTPENGTEFDLSEGGLISVQFNKPVEIETAMINCNQTMTEVEYTLQSENVVMDLKNRIYGLMKNGNLKSGDQFALILDGIHAANNDTVIYGEDGTLVLNYTLAEMPVSLDSTVNVEGNPFLSYWLEDNDKGIITLLFDGELQSSKERANAGVATITCGDLEAGVGGFYHEDIPYDVKNNALTINLTGKLRRAIDMLSAEYTPEVITIKVKDIRGANGKKAYFPGKGGLGSYTFDMPYKEVKAEPISEFTPGPETQLEELKTIEIWVTDYKTIQHDGILFEFEHDAKKDSVITTDFTAEEDSEYEGAYILNVKVPAAVQSAKGEIKVSFCNLKCIDGLDHSADLTAIYSLTTAIETVKTNKINNAIYQLNGVKTDYNNVDRLTNGIYIINGKKMIIRK